MVIYGPGILIAVGFRLAETMGLGSLNYSDLMDRWPRAIASACQIEGGLSKMMVSKVLRWGVTHCRNTLRINHVIIIGRRARLSCRL